MLTLALLLACGGKQADPLPPSGDTATANTDGGSGGADGGSTDGGSTDGGGTDGGGTDGGGTDGGTTDGGTTDGGTDSGDSGTTGPTLFALEGACKAPEPLPDDPLVLSSQLTTGEGAEEPGIFMEALDLEVDWAAERTWMVGQGGFMVFDFDGKEPVYRGNFPGARQRYYKLTELDTDRFVATNRDFGFDIIDASDPDRPRGIASVSLAGASGVAAAEDTLYVTTFDGWLVIYDVSDPSAPRELDRMAGLGTPWDLERQGDWLYVADNSIGVIPIDISDREAPVLSIASATAAAAQDLAVDGDALFVAAGSAGIEIFDLSDPSVALPVSRVSYGAAVINVSADSDRVWGVNHEDVVVVDVSDLARPLPLGSQQTAEWAMCVDASGDRALVGDWGNVDLYTLDPGVLSPEADPSRSELYFYAETEGETAVAELTVGNRGADTLELVGGGVGDPRFEVLVSGTSAAPGEEITVQVRFDDDGEEVLSELCLATNDPDEPLYSIRLASSSAGGSSIAVGETAIDFVLSDTEGDTYQLSDYIGQPVALIFFATW